MAGVGFLVIAASMLLFPVQGLGQAKTDEVKTLKIGYLLCLSGWIDVGPIPEAES